MKCLIKNLEWKNTPDRFTFKLNEKTEPGELTIKDVREFGVSVVKYIRGIVLIDRSSNQVSEFNYKRNPEFNEETLFFETLLEGKANLYQYVDNKITRFFYSLDGDSLVQLVYKRYYNKYRSIIENNTYRQQLKNYISCSSCSEQILGDIRYMKKDLVKYFIGYNECIKASVSLYGVMDTEVKN